MGNVILKLYEGVGATLISKVKQGMMTSLRSKIGALLVKPALKGRKETRKFKGSGSEKFHPSVCPVHKTGDQSENQRKYYKRRPKRIREVFYYGI